MVLREIYKNISSLSQNAFSILGINELNFYPNELWSDEQLHEHKDIVNAIIKGDGEKAKECMRIHLQKSRKRNEQTLKLTHFRRGNCDEG